MKRITVRYPLVIYLVPFVMHLCVLHTKSKDHVEKLKGLLPLSCFFARTSDELEDFEAVMGIWKSGPAPVIMGFCISFNPMVKFRRNNLCLSFLESNSENNLSLN